MRNGLVVLLLIALFISCKKDGLETFTIALIPSHDGKSYTRNEVIKDSDDNNILFSRFKLYISNIVAINNDNSSTSLKDVLLFDNSKSMSFTFQQDIETDIKAIQFNLGLSEALNDSDPINFEDSDPLSIAQNMYWSMLKYRFIILEGKVDTSDGGNNTPEFNFSYHIGTDQMLRTVTTTNFEINDNGLTLNIPFEINDILNDIDIKTNFDNHSETPFELTQGNLVMDNLKKAIE